MLELVTNTYPVKDMVFGDVTEYRDGILRVNSSDIEELVREDENIGEVVISITRPGESARIIHVWDVIEPRTKIQGPGTVFPGWLSDPSSHAEGIINRLTGAAIVTCTQYSSYSDAYNIQAEDSIDMSGSLSGITPYSKTHDLIIEVIPRHRMSVRAHNRMTTLAGLKAARFLAETTRGIDPDHYENFSFQEPDPKLPNIALILVVSGSSASLDTYINGYSCIGTMPTLIHPNDMDQGSLVASTSLMSSTKNFTYDYQNNGLITELKKYNGINHNFVGVIVERGYAYEYNEKVRLSSHAANLALHLDATGVIITSEGGGNILLETMLACRECEKRGIKTALVMSEFCGHEGTGSSFIDFLPEADLIVSTGNADEMALFPEMKKVYGGQNWIGTDLAGNRSIRRGIYETVAGANSMLGNTRLRAHDH